MKIALGASQFGRNYGAFNPAGQVPFPQVAEILDFAESQEIRTIDTARDYGESERVLGRLGACSRFHVITKIPSLVKETDKSKAVAFSVEQSCAALGVDNLDTVMFHNADDLLSPGAGSAWSAIVSEQDAGRIGRIGVSVYDGETATKIAKVFPISVVQLPVSIFDQRCLADGSLDWLNTNGIEVHARSIFLQGFALADPMALPPALLPFSPLLTAFQQSAKDHGISPLVAALGFVGSLNCIDQLVVGIQSKKELADILRVEHVNLIQTAQEFACGDLRLILPSKWK